ncbi:unnamed protein product, partial [Discosporangium mesarthrocarpum]
MAVNKFTGGYDGGGGFSKFFPSPDYQSAHTAAYVASDLGPPVDTFNTTNRGYPDIAASGHNFAVVIGGELSTVGGTSASSPALAGLISLLNERLLAAGRPPLGFLNPALYQAAEECHECFQSVKPRTYNLEGTALEPTLGTTWQVGEGK